MCHQTASAPGTSYGRRYGHHRGGFDRHFRSMPVNIEEKDEAFELFLYAPGLIKENINIAVKDDLLKISYKAPEETGQEKNEANFTRREYHANAFERSFILNGKVDTEKISASYTEGVLKLVLPKRPEANKPAQQVKVV